MVDVRERVVASKHVQTIAFACEDRAAETARSSFEYGLMRRTHAADDRPLASSPLLGAGRQVNACNRRFDDVCGEPMDRLRQVRLRSNQCGRKFLQDVKAHAKRSGALPADDFVPNADAVEVAVRPVACALAKTRGSDSNCALG